MSSVDPRWAPPVEVRHRPGRLAYVLAVVLPVALVLALAAPFAAVWAWPRLSARLNPAESSNPGSSGQPGVGDPYFPDYGSSGYDAVGYTIAVDFDPGPETLRGTTRISARATQRLESFYVDLALEVERVLVDGQPAAYERQGFLDVKVTPAEPIASETTFAVEVAYAGRPGKVRRDGTTPWLVSGEEWTLAGEPESAAWWFPSNDHPSDPARMDVSVRVPDGLEVVSVGRLAAADRAEEANHDTWHWVAEQPMATYLNFLAIGPYALEQGSVDGRPYVYAVSEQLPAEQRDAAFAALRRSGEVVRRLEGLFGRYPFGELGGVVPAADLKFDGLETQTRPVYDRASILNPNYSTTLIVHELAHMWFGNQVTVAQWNDIFLSEAYASWAQWAVEERSGGRTADARLARAYELTSGNAEFWRVTMDDPGADHLFDVVYTRGPMALQALRNVIGDEAFGGLAREWTRTPASASLEEWMVTAQAATSIDLAPFFRAWLLEDAVPARTPANGFE